MSSQKPSPKRKYKLIRRLLLSFRSLFKALKRLIQETLAQVFRNSQSGGGRQPSRSQAAGSGKAGFVLPTTILVLLVIGLFIGALITRSGDRAEDVIRTREGDRIDSVAAPAVERAKAKLEYLFNQDTRLPVNIPTETILRELLLYQDTPNVNLIVNQPDPYTLPDETRLNLDGQWFDNNQNGIQDPGEELDNAWSYQTDLDGDGVQETVAYSILVNSGLDNDCDGFIQRSDPDPTDDFPFNEDTNGNGVLDPGEDDPANGGNGNGVLDVSNNTPQGRQECQNRGRDINQEDYGYWSSEPIRLDNLITKTGPINVEPQSAIASNCNIDALRDQQGWFGVSATSVRKNFQVNVFVENQSQTNKTVTALEFQQDRQLDKGNKFGVWFRYDLLIHPGPQFNLNGAIHTDGNLITWNGDVRFYLVSSPASCIYSEDASIIEVTQTEDVNTNQITFQGQAISATPGTEDVDLFVNSGIPPTEPFGTGDDSVDGSNNSTSDIYDYTLDPLVLYTEDRLVSRESQIQNNPQFYDTSVRDSSWATSNLAKRIRNDTQEKPYVDDFYRADNRWGPKPAYGKTTEIRIADLVDTNGNPIGFQEYGTPITDDPDNVSQLDVLKLLDLSPPQQFPEEAGLDGYWERRAYIEGLRVIVGQRLELGNAFGWLQDRDGDGNFTEDDNNNGVLDSPPQVAVAEDFNSNGEIDVDAGDQYYGDDPLNPIQNLPSNQFNGSNDRVNEQRQLKSLRDNLAAVQPTLVYHYNDDDDQGTGDFPVATLATTAHPGTQQTVANSTAFGREATTTPSFGSLSLIDTDFLQGVGSNGWEFEPPGSNFSGQLAIPGFSFPNIGTVTNDATFAALIDNPSFNVAGLRKALENLANFAGDPNGAFPPAQDLLDGVADANDAVPAVGEVVHPYPQLTMWGDYSNLRRVLNQLSDPNISYSDLSLADKTTLQTASATLGMLGYNLLVERVLFEDAASDPLVQALGQTIVNLMDGDVSNGEMPVNADPNNLCGGNPPNPPGNVATSFGQGDCPDVDPYGEDRDNDGIADPAEDTNNNGILDPGEDLNNNGVLDPAEVDSNGDGNLEGPPAAPDDYSNYYTQFTPEQWLEVIDAGDYVNNDPQDTTDAIEKAAILIRYRQIERDRGLGFSLGLNRGIPSVAPPSLGYNPTDATYKIGEDIDGDNVLDPGEDTNGNGILDPGEDTNGNGILDPAEDTDNDNNIDTLIAQGGINTPGQTFNNIACDPATNPGSPSPPNLSAFGLSVALCPANYYVPKYPSLYYLFPIAEHDHQGNLSPTALNNKPNLEVIQPAEDTNRNGSLDLGEDTNGNGVLDDEPYVSDPYINEVNPAIGQPNPVIYQVVGDLTGNAVEDDLSDYLLADAIALPPRDRSNWVLPETTTPPSVTPNNGGNPSLDDPQPLTNAAINQINDDGTTVYIPFLDKGMYNGRQQMAVRTLNVDLGLLRDNSIQDSSGNDIESWLPTDSGIIYAFREDAVREDGIARPRQVAWTSCDTETDLTNTANNCYMDPAIPRDPPKLDTNGVTPKPVDYIADPDRKPYGFRLSNGSKLGRANSEIGISFITDNPLYILGDFNLHSRQEFTQLVPPYGNSFYQRNNYETGFAKADLNNPTNTNNDDWRLTEILADAITILSNSYCDGVIADTILGNNTCNSGTSSFRDTKFDNSNGGNNSGNSWNREDPNEPEDRNRNGSLDPGEDTNNNGVLDVGEDTNSNGILDPPEDRNGNGTIDAPTTPIAVSRNGEILFNNGTNDSNLYNNLRGKNNVQNLNNASETTVNAIIVQGLGPTRENESYGGLHNFPRFNENWGVDLNITGSFIQLNFSNYDTGGYDHEETFQPATSATGPETIPYYRPPNRNWGYDVALQYQPPGPIVERLLSESGLRSELYEEIDVKDAYIQQLCKAANPNSPTCP